MSPSNHFPNQAKTKPDFYKLFWLTLLGGLALRLIKLDSLTPFFSDQDWFYQSAVNSVFSGNLPLTGITTSITWLHQGAFWTYLLIPPLVISNFHPISGTVFITLLNFAFLPLIYSAGSRLISRKVGFISMFLAAYCSFFIIQSRIAYHTSPIPLFFVITLLLLLSRRYLFAGLFLGLLYQLHLLTIVFWPLVFYVIYRSDRSPWPFLFGLVLGVLPFILSGPVQSLGIIFWLIRFVIGHSSTSGISVAYQMVFFTPIVLIAAFLLSKLNKWGTAVVLGVFLVFNLYQLVKTNYDTLSQPTIREVIAAPISRPDSYIKWWKQRKIQ